MEPGDLRINSRVRDDGGVPKNSPGNYVTVNEGNSVLHFRSHVRPPVITDGRMHGMPTHMPGAPLVIDRNEPVKVYRDPSLINSGEIRHVVSMQHSGVVHLSHPMATHAGVNTSANMYHQHHDNKPVDTTSRVVQQNTAESLRARAPVVYSPPHLPNNVKAPPENWRPGVVQTTKDFRVSLSGKASVEQAVDHHFVESLRLANWKGSAPQAPVVKQEDRLNSHPSVPLQRFYPPTHEKRHHEMSNPQVIYQIHQHQALNKPELPTPPPLRSEQQYRTGNTIETSRKHQIYGPPEVISRHESVSQNNIRYEPEPNSRLDVLPSDNCVRYQKLPPAPRRPTAQSDLQLERNRSPFPKHAPPSASPNSYHVFPQTHLPKHKVNSPAPSHIYGKPGLSTRPYDIINDPSVPLPLTSKVGLTRPSQSSPTSYSHTSPTLPQHEVRKTDVAYYMYNNGPPGYQPSMSPQAHIHSIQTQPLDLGGKRKMEDESVYKGPTTDYTDHSSIKPMYGSRKPLDDPRAKLSHNHINSPLPLSLSVCEIPSKRKIEDTALSLHSVDPKKLRSESVITGGISSNLMIARKDHDIKPTISEFVHQDTHNNRPYTDNLLPASLTVSLSDTKPHPKTTTPTPPPLDIKKTVVHKTGAIDATPIPVITQISSISPLCNGKHKDNAAGPTVNTVSIITADPKPEINITKVKEEPRIPSASSSIGSTTSSATTSAANTSLASTSSACTSSATTSSVNTASATSSSTTTTPTKFQKVPKKAWVLQWHEGDNAKAEEENTAVKGSGATDVTKTSGSNTSSTVVNDKVSSEESSEKLPNGHVPASSENEAKAVSTTPQSLNGFSKERLNDSDVCSENESDNSGKDKTSTDSSSMTKKVGRKGKCSGQASPKPDLRKDGLCKRPPVSQLKKTGESFIQAETCNRVTPKIGKCRECRWHPSGRGSKKQSGAYCRFYGFRKLRYTKGGSLTVAGFSDPFIDPPKITEHDQFRLWLPSNVSPEGLDITMSKYLLSQLCDQFCDLVHQEEEARHLTRTQEMSVIAWKPLLKGVLEMCDVCDTTLFNFHWACGKCGFVVCLSCFKSRQNEVNSDRVVENILKDRDEFQWLLCSNRCAHELDKLMLVQTIAGDALTELNKNVHSVCNLWNISQNCNCKLVNESLGQERKTNETSDDISGEEKNSHIASELEGGQKSDAVEKGEEDVSDTHSKTSIAPSSNSGPLSTNKDNEDTIKPNGCNTATTSSVRHVELQHFKRPNQGQHRINRKTSSVKTLSSSEIDELYPNVKHSWLCNGKLLQLLEPQNTENTSIFHDLWKRGQPVLVSNIADNLDKSLWTPESFSKDFGDYKNDLVNCLTGEIVPNQQLKKFWEGFTCISKRIRDDNGDPLLLKLKDWPPTDDFAQTLPSRFHDLMGALPLADYTRREGKLNLVSRLPIEFMKPDLGPKMYIAYGSGSPMDKGTTNLHLDISDGVNLLVYCESPQDVDKGEFDKAVINAIEDSDCDLVTINRVLQKKEVPGALWHLYDAKDADKIRDLLNKVATEKGEKVEPNHDAIHEQNWYLDRNLRERLRKEYDVIGYAVLQCIGDAVFIPAGAPHQVRNLQNCIKVAEDFISPENISHSLYLSEEELSTLNKIQTNNEDKLQIKNVMYHAVKDALTVLLLQSNEKSEVHKNTSNEALVASTVLSKDCQFPPSTSLKELPPVVVNATTN